MPNRPQALEAAMYAEGYIPEEQLRQIDALTQRAKRLRDISNEIEREQRQEEPDRFTLAARGNAAMDRLGYRQRFADEAETELRRFIDMVANQGRNGDTELAHVTPREKMLLEIMGGSGTINPRTGLREYFEGGESRSEAGSDFGDSSTTDAVAAGTESGFGTAGQNQQERDIEALSDAMARGDVKDSGTVTGGPAKSDGPPGPAPAAPSQSFMDSAINLALNEINPASQRGVINAMTGLAPGFGVAALGARGIAQGLGETIGRFANDRFGGNAPAEPAPPTNTQDFGGRSDDLVAALQRATPIAEPMIRPAELGGVPSEIESFIGPGMSDLQQRALISTYGTQGVNSAFRSDPVRRYYARLLQRGLLQDGRPAPTPYTLPIERLYMENVMGSPVANPEDSRAILSGINRYL